MLIGGTWLMDFVSWLHLCVRICPNHHNGVTWVVGGSMHTLLTPDPWSVARSNFRSPATIIE